MNGLFGVLSMYLSSCGVKPKAVLIMLRLLNTTTELYSFTLERECLNVLVICICSLSAQVTYSQ